jgi:hypothetical protein
VPRDMGTVVFPNVQAFTIEDGLQLRKPEVLGAVYIAMESDNTPWGDIAGLIDRVKDRALRPALERLVANHSVPLTQEATDQLVTEARRALTDIMGSMDFSFGDAVSLELRSLGDADDLVDTQAFLFLAVDEECQRFIGTPPPLPANVHFGRLTEQHLHYGNTPPGSLPLTFTGGALDGQARGCIIDANFDITSQRHVVAPLADVATR